MRLIGVWQSAVNPDPDLQMCSLNVKDDSGCSHRCLGFSDDQNSSVRGLPNQAVSCLGPAQAQRFGRFERSIRMESWMLESFD